SISSGSGSYTPTSPNFNQTLVTGPMETSSPSNGMLPYNLTMDMTNPNLPDLSAMMFPSAEPFTYPNQPLTTFENNQFAKDPNIFDNFGDSKVPVMMSGQSSGPEDNLEAQFYPLPPYMMQQPQQQQQQQQQQGRWDMGMMQQQQQMANMRQVSGGWPGQQPGIGQGTGFPNINLNDMFGDTGDATGVVQAFGCIGEQGFMLELKVVPPQPIRLWSRIAASVSMAPRSRNPFGFGPWVVTFFTVVVYAALFAALIVSHHVLPPAPSTPTPHKWPGVNTTQAWNDLEHLSRAYHPFNSRENVAVRNWLLARVRDILDA
ncbi:hypothetical protein KCU67_g14423, partial [Aureobasidium melanogenum]